MVWYRRLLPLLGLLASQAVANTVELTWVAPDSWDDGAPLEQVDEYLLRYGCAQSGSYDQEIRFPGGVEVHNVDGLPDGTCYFVLHSVAGGVESVASNEASATLGDPSGDAPGGVSNLHFSWSASRIDPMAYADGNSVALTPPYSFQSTDLPSNSGTYPVTFAVAFKQSSGSSGRPLAEWSRTAGNILLQVGTITSGSNLHIRMLSRLTAGDTIATRDSTFSITFDAWHVVVARFTDADNWRVVVDSITPEAFSSVGGAAVTSLNQVILARSRLSSSATFAGSVAYGAYWFSALSDSAMDAIAAGTASPDAHTPDRLIYFESTTAIDGVDGATINVEGTGSIAVDETDPPGWPPAAAGDDLVRVRGESVELSEAQVVSLALARAAAESLNLSEVTMTSLGLNRLSPESLEVSESSFASMSLARTTSESLSLFEAVLHFIESGAEAPIIQVLAESLETGEQIARVLSLVRSASESVEVAEGVSRLLSVVRVRTEDLEVVESLVRSFGLSRIRGEGVELSELTSRTAVVARIVGEAFEVLSAASRAFALVRARNEVTEVSETAQASIAAELLRVIDEALSLDEATLHALAAEILRIINEVVELAEQSYATRVLSRSLMETVEYAEVLAASRIIVAMLSEVLNVGETSAQARSLVRTVTEALPVAEVAFAARVMIRLIGEVVEFAEDVDGFLAAPVTGPEVDPIISVESSNIRIMVEL
jgi:hypothetical protein